MIDLSAVKIAISELKEDDVYIILNDFMTTNPKKEDVYKVLTACQEGMRIVGEQLEMGEYFIGDLIFTGELMMDAINILLPDKEIDCVMKSGTIVLGTALGDLHDIGKNIFKRMATVSGFRVYDLGIDQPPEAFIDKVKEVKPDIVGISGGMALVQESIKDTVDALIEAELRDSVKIIVGGNQMTKEACNYIGADAFAINASEGIKIIQDFVVEYNNLVL